jgi:hypothetical protein
VGTVTCHPQERSVQGRLPKLATKTDAVYSDDSSENVLMGHDMASGGARHPHAGGAVQVNGEMHSYDSVLSRLVTSVEALQARVFGSDEAACPPPPVSTTVIEPPRPQVSGHASAINHISTLNQLRQDPTMMAQANSMVERVEAASLGAYGYNNKNLKGVLLGQGGKRLHLSLLPGPRTLSSVMEINNVCFTQT